MISTHLFDVIILLQILDTRLSTAVSDGSIIVTDYDYNRVQIFV